MATSEDNNSPVRYNDPVFLNSRRESLTILAAWRVGLVWVVGYCYRFGYQAVEASSSIIWGMPSWVFWGVALPWGLAAVWSVWFGLFRMTEDDLGEGPEDHSTDEEGAGDHHG